MKIYRVRYTDVNEGVTLSWHPNKVDALRFCHMTIDEGPSYSMDDFEIEPAEIPNTKRGLIEWLNEHCSSPRVDGHISDAGLRNTLKSKSEFTDPPHTQKS